MEFNGISQLEMAKRLSDYIEYDAITTPSAFAVQAGIDASGFHKMLKGQLRITTNTLKKISECYGLNMEWLLTGNGEQKKKPEAIEVTYQQSNSGGNNQQGNGNEQIVMPCPDDAAHIRELEKEIENLRAQLAHKDDIISELRSSAVKQDERISELKEWITDLRKAK
ncbi:MAG: helix-turn-helix domain-containing protein [Muribaculaceae bacterium]|nr:helix-turn-helix domain-containing protein [Muribaculaceae bacterium]